MILKLIRGKKTPPAPLPPEDEFLRSVRCAVHDFGDDVDEEIRKAKLARKAKKKLRRKPLFRRA